LERVKSVKFNINNYIRVKLTPRGRELMIQNHKELFAPFSDKYPVRKINEKRGWSEWQLWELMHEFGRHMRNGREVPFETEIEIIVGDK
jgi:hypothetical protein